LRIALAQMEARAGDVGRNLDRIELLTRDAQRRGSQIVCFPELSVSGYVRDTTTSSVADGIPGDITGRLEAIARDASLLLCAGLLERGEDGAVYNTQVLVSGAGLVGVYRKTHVPPYEAAGFEPGSELPVFQLPSARIGIEICFDAHFPEVSAVMAQLGAELLLMPHASVGETHDEKLERWMRFLPARAYDNSVFVASCNQTGENGIGDRFPGCTVILDPFGRIIARSTGWEPQLVVADLDPMLLERARADEATYFHRLRRPDLYFERAVPTRPRAAVDS